QPGKFSFDARPATPMAERHQTPEQLAGQNGPERLPSKMLGGEQHLISRNSKSRRRIPLAKRCASLVVGHGARNILPCSALCRAAQSEVDVLQIGFERFVQRSDIGK